MKLLPRVAFLAAAFVASASPAFSTWSIVAVNTRTREVCVAGATCLANFNLRLNLPVVRPGLGGGVSQALVDTTGANRQAIWNGLASGLTPQQILQQLSGLSLFQQRQFGIVDFDNAPLTFTGSQTAAANLGVAGVDGEWRYAIQGNILIDNQVVFAAEQAFLGTSGDIGQKVMAAMEAARFWGGDGRCSCDLNQPTSCPVPPPEPFFSAYTGFFLIARVGDTGGSLCNPSAGCAQGQMYAAFNAIGNPTTPDPVVRLRALYDTWRAALAGRPDHIRSEVLADRAALVADGRSRAAVTLVLRDVEGARLASGGAAVTLQAVGTVAASASAVLDNGDGSYSFELAAGTSAGLARYRIVVNDGVSPVQLYPDLTLRVDPLVPLHAGFDSISAANPRPVPLVVNAGADTNRRVLLLLGTNAGTSPGFPLGTTTLPLNASPLLRHTLTNAGGASLAGTFGELDPTGHAQAWFTPPPELLPFLAGTRVEWSGVVFTPTGRVALPLAGFDVLP